MGFIERHLVVVLTLGLGLGTPRPIYDSAWKYLDNFIWFKILCNNIHEILQSHILSLTLRGLLLFLHIIWRNVTHNSIGRQCHIVHCFLRPYITKH